MDDNSDVSDELDAFEESTDDKKRKIASNKNQTTLPNGPYDEAYEVSQDLSMAESFDAKQHQREKPVSNNKYDYAIEVSQSLEPGVLNHAMGKPQNRNLAPDNKDGSRDLKDHKMNGEINSLKSGTEQTRSQSVLNNKFDEAFEVSQSGSEESLDARDPKHDQLKVPTQNLAKAAPQQQQQAKKLQSQQPQALQERREAKKEDGGSSDEEDGEHEESYDNIEGAYNPKDYQNLNVPPDVRDLFQYIERYKPQEVELETPLKCFIPEFIPAIGELDAFLKIPRPDHPKEDGSGLKYLDEPASSQSDPTVLELQLRAKSKKLQYGDVVVRSIENADKNPSKIDRWIQDINELHRSKPPPQVNYRKNMPDIDKLMDIWPEEFEQLLNNISLPSPDLDLSLLEYVKVLCSLLDIPVYDNPIESLHLMFSLFIEFKNNPHFQERLNLAGVGEPKQVVKRAEEKLYGGADVLQIEDDYK